MSTTAIIIINLFNSFSAETIYRRQNLTSIDGSRAERVTVDADITYCIVSVSDVTLAKQLRRAVYNTPVVLRKKGPL